MYKTHNASVYRYLFEKNLTLIKNELIKVSIPGEAEEIIKSLYKELDRIAIYGEVLLSAGAFMKLNIESLQILIRVIRDHLRSEGDPVVMEDLSRLLIELEGLLQEKEENIN